MLGQPEDESPLTSDPYFVPQIPNVPGAVASRDEFAFADLLLQEAIR